MDELEAQAIHSHRVTSSNGQPVAASGEPSTLTQAVAASGEPSTSSGPVQEQVPEPFDVSIEGVDMQLDPDLEILPMSDDERDQTWRPGGIEGNSDAESVAFLSEPEDGM